MALAVMCCYKIRPIIGLQTMAAASSFERVTNGITYAVFLFAIVYSLTYLCDKLYLAASLFKLLPLVLLMHGR